jgi:hypothetical protein
MTTKTLIVSLIFALIFSNIYCQKLEYKQGRPTSKGINEYIGENEENFLIEYQEFIQDTLFDVYFEVDNLSEYYNYDNELGTFSYPNLITITNEERYLDYELQLCSKYKKSQYVENNAFVKSVAMHELSHYYFYLVVRKLKDMHAEVDNNYLSGLRMFPNNVYGSDFLEEGFCEYISWKMGMMIVDNNYVPKSQQYVVENQKAYEIKYRYARIYVEKIMNIYGIKKGLRLILTNKPPSYEEIFKPELYLERLK